MQIIYFLWDHCANLGNVENREPHKPTFGGGPSSAVQTILLLSKIINKTESPVFVHLFVFLYTRLKNGRIMLYPLASVRPSVNFLFPCNSSYSLRPIELKLGIH